MPFPSLFRKQPNQTKQTKKSKPQNTLTVRKHQKQHTWLTSPSLLCQGVFLFILGMGINIHSDYLLRQLRKPGEITYRIPQGNVSPTLQILTLPWEPVPGISLWVTKERAQMMQSIPAGPWLLPHVPSCPTIHLCSWSEPERAREEPPGRFMVMIPSVWGVWGLGSGGSRQSLSCCLSCTVLGFSREVEPSEYRLPRGLSGKESTCQCRSHRRTGV